MGMYVGVKSSGFKYISKTTLLKIAIRNTRSMIKDKTESKTKLDRYT